MINLRTREIERIEIDANIIQNARHLFNGNRQQGVDDIERRKNVLWLNAIKILQVRGSHRTLRQKVAQVKRLLRYRQIYWHSIQNYIESKTVLARYADKSFSSENLDDFWRRFKLQNEQNNSIFRDKDICAFMRDYEQYCI